MSDKIDSTEKKIIAAALAVSAAHLILIAYAAVRLGLTVPDCVTGVAPFDHGELIRQGEKRYEAHYVARMWGFEPARVTVPTGSTVDFFVTSKDVNHGFHVDGTNVNMMASPFLINESHATFHKPGVYPILCNEYCGSGHQAMSAVVEVSDTVSDVAAAPVAANVPAQAALPGRKVYELKGCVGCHSLDGKPGVGPTFKGLWGKTERFTDGTSAVVGEAYVRESIAEPQKKIVQGFGPLMPKLPISDEEAGQLVEFIKTVK